MYPIATDLQVSKYNKSPSYLPIRQKANEFSWDSVTGNVLSHVLQQSLQDYSIEAFREDCRAKFKGILSEPKAWEWLDRMYFREQDVLRVSPLFLLFKAQKGAQEDNEDAAANQRMSDLFTTLLYNFALDERPRDALHFVEQLMLDVLAGRLQATQAKGRGADAPYLPFLADAFQQDIAFLASRPQYLMAELINTLKLYAFAYCSQLALAVRDWRAGVPKPKELYFILDVEKASTERAKIRDRGYRLLANTAYSLFPVLSAREVIQPEGAQRPLWQIYADAREFAEQDRLVNDLNRYNAEFAENRRLTAPMAATSIEEAFKHFVDLAVGQFARGQSDRYDVNQRVLRELESKVFADFVKSRGRAGKILMLNQDQLLLLTNLAIGRHDKLRFFELLRAFEQRGFFFDNQSQQVLIEFFERMGNVERMSDSGEAVYVRKTV